MTLITVFVHNLFLAVIAGVILSALVHVRLNPHDLESGERIYNLQGLLFFGSLREFSERLSPLKDPDEVITAFKDTRVCDDASLEGLRSLTERSRKSGKRVRLRHLRPDFRPLLKSAGPLVVVEVGEDDPHYSIARILRSPPGFKKAHGAAMLEWAKLSRVSSPG